MEIVNKNQERIYQYSEACVFRKTKEAYGGLSNMASGFPLKVNRNIILSSEALYQACRFPHLPEVQKKIIAEKSPMTAKMVGKPFRENTRADWDSTRVDIMYWCLRVKLAQHFVTFGQLLETTFTKDIVEESSRDPFWGAMKDKNNETLLRGINALGRLLMKLRQNYHLHKFDLLYVEPLNIPDFLLFGEPIQVIDERHSFIDFLYKHWGLMKPQSADLGYVNGQNNKIISIVEKEKDIASLDIPIENKITNIISSKSLTAKEILSKLDIDWSINKLVGFLKKMEGIEVKKEKKENHYTLKGIPKTTIPQPKLFL